METWRPGSWKLARAVCWRWGWREGVFKLGSGVQHGSTRDSGRSLGLYGEAASCSGNQMAVTLLLPSSLLAM